MKHIQQFKLIDGTFETEEARNLLLELISYKINFHAKEKFSNQERFGKDVLNSGKRMEELKEEETALRKLLEKVKSENFRLNVKCNIEVEIINQQTN